MNILILDCETTSEKPPRQVIELCLKRGLEAGNWEITEAGRQAL